MTHDTVAASAHLIDGKYMKDRKGRLVPVEQVPQYDIEMDNFVRANIAAAIKLQNAMREFKLSVTGDCSAFQELLDERYGVQRGGAKGNVSFSTYDGAMQILISMADIISCGPEIMSAKALIDECINDWSEGANENLRAIVNDAFELDRNGKLNLGRILSLLRINIKDERWEQAKAAIKDSLQVNETKGYLNFRQRSADGKLQNIPLDMAAL